MNGRKALARGIIILGIVSLAFLAGCGGSTSQSVKKDRPTPMMPPQARQCQESFTRLPLRVFRFRLQ